MLNQLVRYDPVVRSIESLRGGGLLLDVGSGSEGVARWLGDAWKVVAVDVSFADYGGASGPSMPSAYPVIANGERIPARDATFDVVVCLDVVEHLPRARRERLLRELVRVTKRLLIVGCPTDEPAERADRRFFDHLTANGPGPPAWLVEHVEHGLPSAQEIERILAPHGRLSVAPSENVVAHERMMRMEVHPRWHRMAAFVAKLCAPAAYEGVASRSRSFLLDLVRGWDRPPAYRTLFRLARGRR